MSECTYCTAECSSKKIQNEHENVCIFKGRSCRNQIIDMLQEVLEDTMTVFDFGAAKHPDSGNTPNFLMPDGNKCSMTVRGNSCLHHSADLRAGSRADEESGLHPALHLISSAAILYIRQKRNIIHSDDELRSKHETSKK